MCSMLPMFASELLILRKSRENLALFLCTLASDTRCVGVLLRPSLLCQLGVLQFVQSSSDRGCLELASDPTAEGPRPPGLSLFELLSTRLLSTTGDAHRLPL